MKKGYIDEKGYIYDIYRIYIEYIKDIYILFNYFTFNPISVFILLQKLRQMNSFFYSAED